MEPPISDYFFRFETFQMPIGPLLFSVTIVPSVPPLYGVRLSEQVLDDEHCTHVRFMHIPISHDVWQVVQSNQLENFVPAEFVLRSLRSRL